MKEKGLIVAYCANRNIYSQLITSVNSLLANNKNIERIYLLIEDDELETVHHPKIQFINLNDYDFLIREGFNCTRQFPYTALVRCFFTKILNEEKVLYLDVDTIVDEDLTGLWNFDLGNSCLAARFEDKEKGYFNSGVLLMNLKLINKLSLDDKVIRLLKKCRFAFPDQDAMNLIFKGCIKELPFKYNVLGRDEVYDYPISIRHFAGVTKPWKNTASELDKKIWNKYKVNFIYEKGVS